MSTYVIGDVHGCYLELEALLKKIDYGDKNDELIFVGDLVGRGPDPISTVQRVMELGDQVTHVLGNHDLRWLYYLLNLDTPKSSYDVPVCINKKLKETIIEWLSSSQLLYCDNDIKLMVVHAGIPPSWSMEDALYYSAYFDNFKVREGLEETLKQFMNPPILKWFKNMTSAEKINYILNHFTRMKFCTQDETLNLGHQCAPGKQPENLIPWYQLRADRQIDTHRILFGHWAALGLHQEGKVLCCDTACVWGGSLTAIEVTHTTKVFQVESAFNANFLKEKKGNNYV